MLDNSLKYVTLHLNIRSLPGKYENLRDMIADLQEKQILIHFILLCETFLTDVNCTMFPIPGYTFVCNNRTRSKEGGVALYIHDSFHYNLRADLTINYDNEFESIFVEINHNNHRLKECPVTFTQNKINDIFSSTLNLTYIRNQNSR